VSGPYAAALHRRLDRSMERTMALDGHRRARAAPEDGERAGALLADVSLLPTRMRGRDGRSMERERAPASARVLLTVLTERISARGNRYMTGLLGKAGVVAFSGKVDARGRETWELFVKELPPRDDGPEARR
jgi:hypothetical protein